MSPKLKLREEKNEKTNVFLKNGNGVKLRKFSPSDLSQIIEIEKASFPKKQIYSKSFFEKYYKEYPEGFVIAENEREIIGYAIGKLKGDSTEIISLAVKPDFRQKGIGAKLTNLLISHFKKECLKETFLRVRTKNEVAISFYQNLGFKILKTIKDYYQNGDDAYVMRKEI